MEHTVLETMHCKSRPYKTRGVRRTIARIRRRTRQQTAQKTEHYARRRSKARRRRQHCDAWPEQRADAKTQHHTACSLKPTTPRKSEKKNLRKKMKNGLRGQTRKKGKISGKKTPPRGARFLVPTDHNFDTFPLRRARGLFGPPKLPPGGRLRQDAQDRRAAKKGTRQCIFSGAGGPQRVKSEKTLVFS